MTLGNSGSAPRRRGDAFERKTRRLLDAHGFVTARSAGSHGTFDVIALRLGEVVMVQAKADGRCDPGEWNALLELANSVGALAVISQRGQMRGSVEFRRLREPKGGPREVAPLWEQWIPLRVDW